MTFSTFASRTVDGELKRWFRDKAWAVRPPRSTQERHLALRRAEDELTQKLGRSPTVKESAARRVLPPRRRVAAHWIEAPTAAQDAAVVDAKFV